MTSNNAGHGALSLTDVNMPSTSAIYTHRVATMRERVSKDGTVTYQVLFREGKKQKGRTFADEKSAQDFADKIRVLGVKRALEEAEPAPPGMTLDELAEKFWPYLATRVRSDRTVADNKRDYTNWISSHLGYKVAASIDENDVQGWVDRIAAMKKKDGTPRLSAKSIADRHAILHGIYKFGSSPTRKLVPVGHNPCIGTELPERRKKMPQGLMPAEWQALHTALAKADSDAADLAEFLIASAARFSEAIAIDTTVIEDDGTYIWVTISKVARRAADGSVSIVADTKSEAGQRRFKLDKVASTMVRRRVKAVKPGGLVFTTRTGAMWNYSHFYARKWKPAVESAKIGRKVTPHMLRHTAVGYMALSGKVSMPEIQRRVGHSSIKTTIDVYGGMIEDVNDDALDFLAAMRTTPPKTIEQAEPDAIEG